jgi:hypothetical protein
MELLAREKAESALRWLIELGARGKPEPALTELVPRE